MIRPLMLVLGLMPTAVAGARDVIDYSCTILRSCDSAGKCTGNGQKVDFRFLPETVDDQGEGVYRLKTGSIDVEAFFFSEAGPVVWSRGGRDVQTMAFTSARSMVWIDARFGALARSQTHFLQCEEL